MVNGLNAEEKEHLDDRIRKLETLQIKEKKADLDFKEMLKELYMVRITGYRMNYQRRMEMYHQLMFPLTQGGIANENGVYTSYMV